MPPLAFRTNPRLLGVLGVGLGMVGGFAGAARFGRGPVEGLLDEVELWFYVLLGIGVGISVLRKALRQEPLLLLDDAGLRYLPFGRGRIPWAHIMEAEVVEVKGRPMVALHLHHAEHHRQGLAWGVRLAQTLGRPLARRMGMTDFMISPALLRPSISARQLRQQIHLRRAAAAGREAENRASL